MKLSPDQIRDVIFRDAFYTRKERKERIGNNSAKTLPLSEERIGGLLFNVRPVISLKRGSDTERSSSAHEIYKKGNGEAVTNESAESV